MNLRCNKIRDISIPENSRLLRKLEILDLSYNDLVYLPSELVLLNALNILNVSNNFLENIPVCICGMNIKSIDVTGNPLLVPPIEMCSRGVPSMRKYYEHLREETQAKVIARRSWTKRRKQKSSKRRRWSV
jgi:Leucine-rich repeat (LRR) protein